MSGNHLEQLLDQIQLTTKIVSPGEFAYLRGKPTHRTSVAMLTFDDSLRSQFEIALPVLQARDIKAGFAIYSSIYDGEPDPLELFAEFREGYFATFHDFWIEFVSVASREIPNIESLSAIGVSQGFLNDFPFYSEEEKLFRFARDQIMTGELYRDLMWQLIAEHDSFDPISVAQRLWMEPAHLKTLVAEGHSIGLHSHSHPTRMDLVPRDDQFVEYNRNFAWIKETLEVVPEFVAHPCGRYSADTLEVISSLGIRYGFRSSMAAVPGGGRYEIPREDASTLVRNMRNLE